ncbi:ASCH domain-containing protein [Pontibacillus yanchengensis]|uniref:ASCH domain-containing protein n=1 Tax=Pontibacillus yanchengensis TaxID=462910 RepID=A0ACC7VIC6_9BACI|nr:ASCH domain-containing protein [Pontibacillus yanchengensis]MYL53694.1 ASCH domain-containing protein [Pontibacillus yanchengensis]
MNQAAKEYWDTYWGGQVTPESVSAWQFGEDADYLAQLVMDGMKTATCSGHIFYELENEPLPIIEDYSIILNSNDQPVAIIKTTDVTILPMNQVSEEFAAAEGEGDLSYAYWWNTHETFFRSGLKEFGLEFSEDMLVVCERFKLIDVNEK